MLGSLRKFFPSHPSVVMSVACASQLLACGDPLVDGNYRGEPLDTIRGSIFLFDETILESEESDIAKKNVRVTMTWAGLGQGNDGNIDLGVHIALRQEFPGNYQIDIFEAPDDAALVDYASQREGGVGMFAVANVIVFDDKNDDGLWRANDEGVLGTAFQGQLVLYTPTGLVDYERGVELGAGFHIVEGLIGVCTASPDGEMPPIELYDTSSQLHLVIGDPFYSSVDINCDSIGDWAGCEGIFLDYAQCVAQAESVGKDPEIDCPYFCFEENDGCWFSEDELELCYEEAASLDVEADEYCPGECFDSECTDAEIADIAQCVEEAIAEGLDPEYLCDVDCYLSARKASKRW